MHSKPVNGRMVGLQQFIVFSLWHSLATSVAAEIQIVGCESTGTVEYVEGVENPSLFCYGSGNVKSSIEWTLTSSSTGRSESLTTCTGLNNCTSRYNSTFLIASWTTPAYSQITFPNIVPDFSGILVCSEAINVSMETANCTVVVTRARVSYCEQGVDIPDGVSTSLYCEVSVHEASTVTWTLTTHRGQKLLLGNCSEPYVDCQSIFSPNVSLYRFYSNSEAHFSADFLNRDVAEVTCSYSVNDSTDTDRCAMDIYHPAILGDCDVEIRLSNWSLTLYCDVNNFFSSQGRYQLRVYQDFVFVKDTVPVAADGYSFDGYRSFGEQLQSYTNDTDNKLYYSGRLLQSWPLSPVPGTFTSFRVETYPGPTVKTIAKEFSISPPTGLYHNCTNQKYVLEAGVVHCLCTAESLGSPAGRLFWMQGDVIIVTGDYGIRQLVFSSDKLSHPEDVITLRCQADWVEPLSSGETVMLYSTTQAAAQADTAAVSSFKWLSVAGWVLSGLLILLIVVLLYVLSRQGRLDGCLSSKNQAYHPSGKQAPTERPQQFTNIQASRDGEERNSRVSFLQSSACQESVSHTAES